MHAEGVALGARMIWDRSVFIRFDGARSLGGTDTAIYVAFGELF